MRVGFEPAHDIHDDDARHARAQKKTASRRMLVLGDVVVSARARRREGDGVGVV
jgi:hypothetical protein